MYFHHKNREHNKNIFQYQTRELLQEIQHPQPEPVNNIKSSTVPSNVLQIKLNSYFFASAKHIQIHFFKLQAKFFSDKLLGYRKGIISKLTK